MSRIRTNLITNRMANGAPTVSNGLVISGVTTSTSFSGDGSALTGLSANIPGISTSGTSTFNNLNISGVSTFSNPVSIAATTHFASQSTYFGPVLDTGEISIDIMDNTIAGTIDYNDANGFALFFRSASDMYLLADHKTTTSSAGNGFNSTFFSFSKNVLCFS